MVSVVLLQKQTNNVPYQGCFRMAIKVFPSGKQVQDI